MITHPQMHPMEAEIAAKLVRDILDAGHRISVARTVARSDDFETIWAAMGHTETDWLVITQAFGARVGIVYLQYGNRRALIADHTDNDATRALVAPACDLAYSL